MRVIRKPENFERETWEYLSVGYHNGKAILKDELGKLYYLKCEEEIAPIGTNFSGGELLKPVEELEETQRNQIREIYG